MADKRPKCPNCLANHRLTEPHRKPVGATIPLRMIPGAPSVSDAILIDRGPSCANCERLEQEIAFLQKQLETVTKVVS